MVVRARTKKPVEVTVPTALRVAVLVVGAASLGACDPSSPVDASADSDAAQTCFVYTTPDGGELYRDCPLPGSECLQRVFPDGAVRDGPC